MKHDKTIDRADGSKVRIVAELFSTPWSFTPSVSNYALIQMKGSHKWSLCKKATEAASVTELVKLNHEILTLLHRDRALN